MIGKISLELVKDPHSFFWGESLGTNACKVKLLGYRYLPMVPRPPTLIRPNRANGAEQVVILGVIWRITITAEGSAGMSFEVMTKFFRVSVLDSRISLCSRYRRYRRSSVANYLLHF